jgi:hypothetical protein
LVDDAFVDRVDFKVHIGMPIWKARFHILRSCVEELVRVGIIVVVQGDSDDKIMSFEQAILLQPQLQPSNQPHHHPNDLTALLLSCAQQAEGLSGRSLRRLPLQAHAQYLQGSKSVSQKDFLQALGLAIQAEQASRKQMMML